MPLLNPDHVLLIASGLWGAAVLATGLPHRRIPSEFPFLFSLITLSAGLVGLADFTPDSSDALLTIAGVLLFTITPIVITIKLFRAYPPPESGAHGARADGGDSDP